MPGQFIHRALNVYTFSGIALPFEIRLAAFVIASNED